jgi:hypothetical protein
MERAWPRTKGIPSRAHKAASQVPGEEAFDGDDHRLPIRRNGPQQGLGACRHMAMPQDLAVLAEETHVHTASMQINAAIRLVLPGVESHEVSSS